ncbi:ActS/PrrB/RegB family redox-sensitive histidine kinase [Stappia sp. P2PMeth1]|uniref:ActS/PrrB/RegB family redox-sensitive histidine kinase n=1 Tax=Stappia sp. P2PMeth1 TaxID=2003586 RepID=UPI0016486DCC|nr:ActS/PrrB/RegB family redox-sensitive histidine kinase [Stappia sp. P2PMeth1]
MDDTDRPELGSPHRRLKLDTLVRLRWLAIGGQTAALVVVHFYLAYPLPLSLCAALVAASAWLNIFLKVRSPQSQRLSERSAALQLAYDLMQLGGLLYLTGGLGNPFAFLLLAPVMVSAAGLSARNTIYLGLLAAAIATLIAAVHLPLPWPEGQTFRLPPVYAIGVWIALVCSLTFMSIYAFRVAEEARQLSDALMASELVLAREQHLHALDGLAAAAAHELGTPLATVYLSAKELARDLANERDIPSPEMLREEMALILSQAERCREILSKLSSLSDDRDQHFRGEKLSHVLDQVAEPARAAGARIRIDVQGEGGEPVAHRNPAIHYGLGNLLENAVDFADSTVTVTARWNDSQVLLEIADDGHGFTPDVMSRLGEPYVTARGARDGRPGQGQTGGGLGLGFFIAKTLLERTGAELRLRNRPPPEHGAVVRIAWPRDGRSPWRAEAGAEPARQADLP